MKMICPKCERPFEEGDEVQGKFKAYWHEVGSKVHFSMTQPHDYLPDTLEHVSCEGAE